MFDRSRAQHRLVSVLALVMFAACQKPFDAALDRGNAAANAGRWADAKEAFAEAVRLDPASAAALARVGSVTWMLGDHPAAVDAWKKAAALDPADELTADGLARAALEAAQPALAIAAFDKVVNPTGAARLTLVRALLAEGSAADLDRALELGRRATSGPPPVDVEARYLLGCAQLALKRFGDAQSTLDTLQRDAPKSPLASYGLARLAAAQNRQTDTLLHLNEAKIASGTSWNSTQVAADPAFVFLAGTPEFKALVGK